MADCVVAFHADASVFGRVVCSSEPDGDGDGFLDPGYDGHYSISCDLSQDGGSPFCLPATNFNETNGDREGGWAMVSCLHCYLDLNISLRYARLESSQGAPND